MTIIRPLYRFSVTNVDQGWTYTITHTTDPDTPLVYDEMPGVWLTDGLDMAWGFSNDQVPGPLDPDTCSFRLFVKTAADLPDADPGDIIIAQLDRPGPGVDELIPYMHFDGRASDPALDVSPTGGIYMSVQATGVFEDFTANVLWEDPPGFENVEDGILTDLQMQRAIFNYTVNGAYLENLSRTFSRHVYLTGTGMTLQDFVSRMEAALIVSPSTEFHALRSTYDWHPVPGEPEAGQPWYDAYSAYARPVQYYFDSAPLTLSPPGTLAEDADDPDMVILAPAAEGDVTVISARHVQSPTGLRKTRDDIVNDIDIAGIITAGTNVDVRKRYQNLTSIERFGTVTRTVETTATSTGLAAIADGYLNGPESIEWSVPELIITTANMDDAELDQLAPVFYPHRPDTPPYSGNLGRFLILADLPDRIAIGAIDALAVQLVGAAFHVSEGVITITARVRSLPPADFTTSVTFDDLAASPLADTTFTDTGTGHFIDPALDIDELAYSDI